MHGAAGHGDQDALEPNSDAPAGEVEHAYDAHGEVLPSIGPDPRRCPPQHRPGAQLRRRYGPLPSESGLLLSPARRRRGGRDA